MQKIAACQYLRRNVFSFDSVLELHLRYGPSDWLKRPRRPLSRGCP